MKKISYVFFLLFFFSLTLSIRAQTAAEPAPWTIKFRLGLEGESFRRQITTDEQETTSPLNGYFGLLRLEGVAAGDFTFSLLAGYSSSNFNSLVFRRLPFSVAFEGGGLGGILFGGEVSKIFAFSSFGVGGRVRFLAYQGREKKWIIPDLAVEGELKSIPNWQQLSLGPIFNYTGYQYLTPFVSVQYHRLWGKFTMRQIIENLTGEETKEIKAKAFLGISAGSSITLSSRFSLRGEVTLFPVKDGLDYSFNVAGIFSF